MNALPEPLTPGGCDLRSVPAMLLDVQRFRDSDLVVLERPEAIVAAILLWGASWHQVPAASLPDDDRMLAQLAGYGKVVTAWKRVKAGALRGFVKCSDGRLYHPVVAEKAVGMWEDKLQRRHARLLAAIRKHNERKDDHVDAPSFDAWVKLGRPEKVADLVCTVPVGHADVARDTTSMSRGQTPSVPCEMPSNRTEQNVTELNTLTLETSSKDESPSDDGPELRPEHIRDFWNEIAPRLSRPQIRELTPERRQLVKARIAQYSLDDFAMVFGKCEASPFLRGDKGRTPLTFDWIMKKSNFQKTLEGNYDR